ncbi:MAG: PKD domain-containing protein, partial [Bacteroidales bacterium]
APDTWVECTMDLTEAMGRQFTSLQLAACVDNVAEADVWFDDVRLSNPDAGDGTPVLLFSPSVTTLTLGDELTLDASESYDFDGEIVDYSWELGDGYTGSGALLTHTYADGGVYTVTLTITDNDGKSSTGSTEVFVIPPDHLASEPVPVTPDPVTHRKIEFIFQTQETYGNPYDPDEIKIDAVVTLPGGDSLVVPCFYQVPVSYQDQEWQADPVHPSWMLRLSTDVAGPHAVRLMVEDASGTWLGEPVDFQVREGNTRGRILRDADHPQYYRHVTGEPYYPLGINAGWNSIENYTTIMNNLSAGGANVFRYWQTPFNWQSLEWSEDYYYNYEGLGRYNQEAAARSDSLLDLCDSLDLYMQLCIFQHGEFSENVDNMWGSNPYNSANGGYVERAEEYFYSESCRMQTRKLLRYIVARWGYSRNLFAWEFFNEVQFTGIHNSQSELWWPGVVDWHGEMSRYVESIDPYNHLMTTSAAVGQLASLDTIQTLDNLQYHLYDDEETLLANQIGLDKRFLGELKHTSIINGEYGTNNGADTPFDIQRSAIWNGIMTQVPRYMWIWEHYLDPAWADLFSMPSRFLAEEDLAAGQEINPYVYQVSHPSKTLRSLGLSGDSLFMGYLYDPDYENDLAGVTLTLEGLPVANYTLSWWLPESEQVIVTDSLPVIHGTQTLQVPLFSKGIAFKLKYHSPYMLPLANAGEDTTVAVGSPAFLTGLASTSPGVDSLAYLWKVEDLPDGSQFMLTDSTSMEITVTPDIPGNYVFSLVVSDSTHTSEADRVTVRGSLPPVAVAGNDTVVSMDEMYVRIDGAGSYDPDGDPLSYAWVLLDAPPESERV